MDGLTRRAAIPSLFARFATKCFCENLKEHAEVIDRARGSLDCAFHILHYDSNSSKSSGVEEYRKFTKSKQVKRVELNY